MSASLMQTLGSALRPVLARQSAAAMSTYACSKWVTPLAPPEEAGFKSELGKDEARQANNINKWIETGVSDRTVTIWAPSKNVMQSGLGNTADGHPQGNVWKVAFPATPVWENPLMGWASSADPYEYMGRNSQMAFETKERAIRWAEKHGFAYEVKEPLHRNLTRTKRFAQYADNFSMVRKGMPNLDSYPSNNGFGHGEKLSTPGGAGGANIPSKK